MEVHVSVSFKSGSWRRQRLELGPKKSHPTWDEPCLVLGQAGLQRYGPDGREEPAKQRPWPVLGCPSPSQARLACIDIPHKLKTISRNKPLLYYLPLFEICLIWGFLPCSTRYTSLWILNPRQENKTQDDGPNPRIKAQSDVWKMTQTSR